MKHYFLMIVALFVGLISTTSQAATTEIGVVVMHGKGGSPHGWVDKLEEALLAEGFQVANIEMPWSRRRGYDVDMNGGVEEISNALNAMRAKGAQKVFVAGHSQGGLFALHYAGLHSVDGVIPVAPGGQVDAGNFTMNLSSHVAKAKSMVGEGRGNDTAAFADFEGSRGADPITTTAAIYLDWFNPYGAHTTRVFRKVKKGTPVLYVAPRRDYPGLAKSKGENFGWLPSHKKTRMYEPDTDHMNSPGNAAPEIIRWINDVAGN
jgi:pimeloyl-ACP methyl ester carboxylesterase